MSKNRIPNEPTDPSDVIVHGDINQARNLVYGIINGSCDRKLYSDVRSAIKGLDETRRLRLMQGFMEQAKTTDNLVQMKYALDSCSFLFPSSFVETYVDHPEIGIPCDDAYARRYLREFKEKTGDQFRRISKTGIPCSAMEEYVANQLCGKTAVIIVANKTDQPHTLWVYKNSMLEIDSDWDILLNLSTLEVYTPNRVLGTYLHKLKSGTVIELDELLSQTDKYGSGRQDRYKYRIVEDEYGLKVEQLVDPSEIRFARLAHYADNINQVASRDYQVPKLMEKREEILAKYVPLD